MFLFQGEFHGQRGGSFRIARPTRREQTRAALLASLVRADRQPLTIIFDSDRARSIRAHSLAKLARANRCARLINASATHRWISLSARRHDSPFARAVEPGQNHCDESARVRRHMRRRMTRDDAGSTTISLQIA